MMRIKVWSDDGQVEFKEGMGIRMLVKLPVYHSHQSSSFVAK